MLAPSVDTVVASLAGGFSFGLAFFFVRWLVIFMAGRWDKKEAQLNEATKLLIAQLTSEVTRLFERLGVVESDLAECKRKHAESEARWIRAEAAQAGMGDAAQHAQLIISAEKQADKRKDAK